jgi:hypothetical protein
MHARGICIAEQVCMQAINIEILATVSGGAGQAELRDMAKRYCPQTYARNASAPQLTRRMGEQCLDEAGYGMFKGQLDKYFPPQR